MSNTLHSNFELNKKQSVQTHICNSALKKQSFKKENTYTDIRQVNKMESNGDFDKNKEFNYIKKEFKRLSKPFEDIQKLNVKDDEFRDSLTKIIKKFPDGMDLKNSYEGTKTRVTKYIQKLDFHRKHEFSKNKMNYLKELKDRGLEYNIVDNKIFRVSMLEFESKNEEAQVRILFNKIPILPWKNISSVKDLKRIEKTAIKKIMDSYLGDKKLPIIINNAYKRIQKRQIQKNSTNPNLVRLTNLHEEIIKELFLQQIRNKRSYNFKIKEIYFPDWAFAYNLDRYRDMIADLPNNQQLSFETGSQAQTEKIGIVLNGLSPTVTYKKFCFLKGR